MEFPFFLLSLSVVIVTCFSVVAKIKSRPELDN